MKSALLSILIIALFFSESPGQIDTIYVGNLTEDMDFMEFAGMMETDHPVKFHFIPGWVENIRITQSRGPKKLSEILNDAFDGRDVYYFADRTGNIIITRENPISAIREDFLETGAIADQEEIISGLVANGDNNQENKDAPEDQVIFINGGSNGDNGSSTVSLTGRIRDAETGEPMIGAVVYVENSGTGVVSDINGYYLLKLPHGTHFIRYHSLGKKDVLHQVEIHSSGSIDVDLEDKISRLKGVEVIAENTRNVTRLQMGMDKIEIKTIKELPAALGETDIVKAALLLPGVQTVGEGASGFNVRGGSVGQNLFLINSAPVYNSSHLFGFFSIFNPDAISNFTLYKSGIPARYGGRLSSVFEVTTRIGNKKRFSAHGGLSPVTGRLLIEGPIMRDTTSFIIGGRSTYSDWLLSRVDVPSVRNSAAGFYDLNMRINHDFNNGDLLDVSAYYSFDHFRLNSDTSYNYSNLSATVKYEHHLSDKLLASFSGIISRYSYQISSQRDPLLAFNLTNDIQYNEVKTDFAWYPGHRHKIKFGLSSVYYNLNPGSLKGIGDESIILDLDMENESGNETSLYFSEEYSVNDRLLLYAGIRISSFFYLGPHAVYSYQDDQPVELINITDTLYYGSGKIIKPYMGPELRFSLRYLIDRYSSVKLSYNRMRQYLHMISNTTAVSPTDYWKLSDPFIKPQLGDQVAIGYYLDLFGDMFETSTEIYYKKLNNILEYKAGAELLLNDMIESDLIQGSGHAYGLELMIKKMGRLNGWLGYTYSRILYRVVGDFPSEKINSGNLYPANHDKPHDFTMTGNYKFSRRFGISTNFTYSTGRPITYPVSKYAQRSQVLLHYSDRNKYRIPSYMRWDLSATVYGNLKSKKIAHSDWTLSVYNVTGRDNVYSIYFISKDGVTKGYKLSVFNQPIVTLTYNFRF